MENTYILGQPATGKRDLLLSLLSDRIEQGIFIVDESDTVLDLIPKHRRKHVILFDPTREEVLPWDPLSGPGHPVYRATVLLDAMKGAWGYADMTTPDLDLYLSFSLASLMAANQPLLCLPRLFTDTDYRTYVLNHVRNPVIKDHWAEYETMPQKDRRQETKSTLNKVKLLISDPRIARCLWHHEERGLDFAEVVGERRIFVAVLKPGELGESKVRLLASLLLASVTQALKREHPPFHLFLPECQRFAPAIVTDLLTNAHRYGSTVTASHQYIDQLPTPYFSALMGTCARKYVFRTSEEDARVLDRHIPRNQNVLGFDELPNRKARTFPFEKTRFYAYAPRHESVESYRQDILDHLRLTRFVKDADRKVEGFFAGYTD